MKMLFLLLLFCHVASPMTHSLVFLFTGSSGVPNLPEFVGFMMVDEVEVVYCDSNIQKAKPKQDWMKNLIEHDPNHLDSVYTAECLASQNFFKDNITSWMQRFNQSGGVHTLQRMYGCEWDDETEEVNGFDQYGYDGEDFIAFDLKTQTWIAPKLQAVITKRKWDNDRAAIAKQHNYLTQICPDWLKKYVNYGRSSLLRTDLPSVSLLQKTPSSPVSCHATGFYPYRATLFWRKDGEELYEEVEYGEIFPNNDGSFQMSADLDISSVPREDWRKYECVFQLSGAKKDIITKLDKAVIRTNLDLPSVSLLQKTPSSPVSCHATGFYSHRAMMFWRKDGEELFEEVEYGEIFPNNDGSFQMSADLDISSVPREDWRKYECVFQLSGAKKDIIINLDKAVIRTNLDFPAGPVIIRVVVVLVLLASCIAASQIFIWKMTNNA